MQKRTFQIYRYDPDKDAKPYMQTIEIELDGQERMLLDALMTARTGWRASRTCSRSRAPSC
jgi:succinate dehydrogenase/fumarate reductase-like Fe-S protein